MKRYLIFLLIIICSCSNYEGDKDSTDYDSIVISFRGYSKEYSTKEAIYISVTDSFIIDKLNTIKNSSESILFGGRKGNEYTVDLVYTNSDTGDKLLIRIFKNIELKPTIVYGAGTLFDGSYRNDELVEYVTSIIKLDAIKKYEGSLTQKEYDEFILKDGE